ncbi:exocyst complex component EXO70E2-like [Actinidia eriantha]|uniref:exocyst complex component EXO70E2-like n=1 Tax=Actinidia eriantha TaxID=165200 RepID=UPI002586261E|nr:exocyst complex component EXO70E2-like [Actinidia eriantha]
MGDVMEDFSSMTPTNECEEHVFIAARHMLKAVGASKNVSDDLRRLLADVDIHLSRRTNITETVLDGTRVVEERLKLAQEKVMRWESNRSMIWASGHEEASEYLQTVYEIQRLMENLRSSPSSSSGKQKELLDRAHSVLQMAMERLELELLHILAQNKQSFEPEYVSFRSCEEDIVSDVSIVSTEDESIGDMSRRDSSGTESENHIVDLVHPDIISYIKSIANVMFASHYDQEFCHAFTNFWKDALDEYFFTLGIDKLSIEGLLKMEWNCLNCKIHKWIRAVKFIIRVYLAGEKRLFDQVLGEFGSVYSACFVEASKGSMLCLLNFGEAMAIGTRRPEKLFKLLDMYEVLADLLQDVDSLFSSEIGSFIRTEFHELLMKLGGTVRATFMEFGHEVALYPSTNPCNRGVVHPLTKYVMNYINVIVEYASSLNLLLGGVQDGAELVPFDQNISLDNFCPLAHHLRSLMSYLEHNLDKKSRLYKDSSLKHIFMMNNLYYMVQKVRVSKLVTLVGGEWIREYTAKFQNHATNYERVTWKPVLSLLMDDENKTRKSILKERYRSFNISFEEVYKNQTGWFIPDTELRKDLRISISQKVIHAYQTFIGKNSSVIDEKHIKYTADELENFLFDLFEGSPMRLHSIHKR